jgi:hypothetical protein
MNNNDINAFIQIRKGKKNIKNYLETNEYRLLSEE